MKRWKVILAAVLIFATGAVSGALAHRLFFSERPHRPPAPGLGPGLMDSRSQLLPQMQRELHLTTAQSARIEEILKQGRSRMRQVWDTCQPQFREEMRRVREAIQAELNPDQRARFDALYKHSRKGEKEKKAEATPGPATNASATPANPVPPPH